MDKCENCRIKLERDKLLEAMKETADCTTCKNLYEERIGCWGNCSTCKLSCPCAGCNRCSKWEWMGVETDEEN